MSLFVLVFEQRLRNSREVSFTKNSPWDSSALGLQVKDRTPRVAAVAWILKMKTNRVGFKELMMPRKTRTFIAASTSNHSVFREGLAPAATTRRKESLSLPLQGEDPAFVLSFPEV